MSEAKLTRVVMEWSDGSSQELTGDDAAKWLKEVNGCVSFITARNPDQRPISQHPWARRRNGVDL